MNKFIWNTNKNLYKVGQVTVHDECNGCGFSFGIGVGSGCCYGIGFPLLQAFTWKKNVIELVQKCIIYGKIEFLHSFNLYEVKVKNAKKEELKKPYLFSGINIKQWEVVSVFSENEIKKLEMLI